MKTIGNLDIRKLVTGEIVITVERVSVPILAFDSLITLKRFIGALEEFYDVNFPKIPDVFVSAFEKEEGNGNTVD